MKTCFTTLLGLILFPPILVSSNRLDHDHQADDSCEIARTVCAYRTNCAWALRSYMVDCADVLTGRTSNCPWACKRALISLTSSDVGYRLSTCRCAEGDNFCLKSKERVEVCRPEVSRATDGDTAVPCSVAQWICHADPQCSTALDYYHRLCRPLFHGRKCTPRCNNSVAILNRQEKATKLRNCYCDGSENFPCHSIRKNTQKLCFGRDDWVHTPTLSPTSVATDTTECSGGRTVSGHQMPVIFALLSLILLWSSLLQMVDDELGGFRTFIKSTDAHHVENTPETVVNNKHSVSRLWPWWWTSEMVT